MPNAPERPDVLRFGKTLKGKHAGNAASAIEWVGNRHESATSIKGVRDGHGAKIFNKADRS